MRRRRWRGGAGGRTGRVFGIGEGSCSYTFDVFEILYTTYIEPGGFAYIEAWTVSNFMGVLGRYLRACAQGALGGWHASEL